MLYILFSNLVDTFSFFNVFKYLTVRTGLSMFTAMIVVFIAGGPFIRYFSSKKIHNPIRDDGPDEHIVKKIGTPTMGGLLILFGVFSGVLLWGDLSNPYNWFLIYIAGTFGLLGAYDDYKKIKFNNSSGVSSKLKISIQIFLAVVGILILYYSGVSDEIENLYFPFLKNLVINLGWFFIPFYIFVIFISRDVAILIGAAIQMSLIESDTPSPNLLGKLTTSLQIIYISIIFINEIFNFDISFNFLNILIVFVTILSLCVYTLNWYKDLREYHNE